MAEKIAIPITKFYVSDSTKTAVDSVLGTRGLSALTNDTISSLEKSGKVSDDIKARIKTALDNRGYDDPVTPGLAGIEGSIKPFQQGVTAHVGELKSKEANLTLPELQQYLGLLEVSNSGGDFKTIQSQKKEEFKQEVVNALKGKVNDSNLVDNLAEKAAQRFIVERKTGEQSLVDFVSEQGKLSNTLVRSALNPLQSRLGDFLASEQAPGAYQGEITRVNQLVSQRTKDEAETNRQAEQQQLAAGQREKSDSLFQEALKTLFQPTPLFTSQYSPDFLQQLQSSILERGETSLSNVEAQQADRGLTGSSIEAYALAQEEGNITEALANATFQFLAKSGESGQQNKEFLSRSLLSQAQALLGAGQQTESLVTNRELTAQDFDLNRQKLQTQIAQFNMQLQESTRQFNENLDYQKSQASSNLALLLQQLSQGRKGNGLGGATAGALGGAATGAYVGSVVPGIGTAIGAVGGGVIGGLGGYFSSQ